MGKPVTTRRIDEVLGLSAAAKTIIAQNNEMIAALGPFSGDGDNNVLGFLRAMSRKDVSAPSDMGGTYLPSSDSLERLGDLSAQQLVNFDTGADRLVQTSGSIGQGELLDTWVLGGTEFQFLADGIGAGLECELNLEKTSDSQFVSTVEMIARIDRTGGPAPTACAIDMWNWTLSQWDNFHTITTAVDTVFTIPGLAFTLPEYTPPSIGQSWRVRFDGPLMTDGRMYVGIELLKYEGFVLIDIEAGV